MNRLKLLAAAMLLAVPIACGDEIPPPPPTGSIDGLVSIEGQGIDGVSVTLSNGGSATTANGGMYRFDGVEAGAYTVTISNYPDDASFNQTSAAATITTDGQAVTVNFPGTYIRTSSIMGTVTVDNEGLGGVTVSISGTGDSETLTDGNGQYAFTGLRAGNYTIEISGFDDEDVAFGSTQSSAAVGVGESKVVSFEGTYVRTSGIMGQVTADDQPQEDITVSLQGRGENRSVTTNGAGQFSFDQLRRGDYAVGISGYDTDEMTFDVTSQSVTVAYGETTNVPFEGTLLRTAGIDGTVTVEGVGPIANVTVTINGEGETLERTTDHMGVYSFGGLHAGDYSVVISGFDDDEYGFPDGTSATVTVELQETGTVPFDGIMLRTAAIEGTVTVGDNDAPLPGVMVTVSGGPRDEEHSTTTNDDGEYLVENLHAGTYSVTISGYDTREYGFDPTTRTLTVDLRDTGEAAFQGELLRTAGVSGRVHVGGMGLPGVTVTLTGEEDRDPETTDADGQYGFSGLAAGDYTLTISGWDDVEYRFEPTMEITLELDETKTGVNFEGRSLRTATVMGNVTVEGDALAGISVTLIKVESATSGEILGVKPTGDDGGYSFGPLLAGAYQVMIAVDDDELDFGAAGTTQTTAVMTDGTATVDFNATIIKTAGVSGMVTLDDEALADVEVTLTGDHAPDDNTRMTGADGMYSFGGLRKGDYTVTITITNEEHSFPSRSQPVNLSVGQKQTGISFAGELLRTAGVSGRVHVGGNGLVGVTVTLDGPDSRDPETTNADGQYGFSGLAAGDYTLTISGWDGVEYAFDDPTMEVTLELGDTEPANFEGRSLRTVTVMGRVTVDEEEGDGPMGLPGITVKLTGEDRDPETTDAEGAYAFGGLLKGEYTVVIEGHDDEHDFGETGTTQTKDVMTDGPAPFDFAATIIRTAGVSGMVTVDDEAMDGVEVTLNGAHAPADNTMMTDADGMYEFDGLRKGSYTVTMTNPDAETYNFPTVEHTRNLSVGQKQPDVDFAGTRLRQASISGQIFVVDEEDLDNANAVRTPVGDVTVTLSGDELDAPESKDTDGNGEYNFPSLAGGTYTVTIELDDSHSAAYKFDAADMTQETTIDSDNQFGIVDFKGTHTMTAAISGMLFLDEVNRDGKLTDSEPPLDLSGEIAALKEAGAIPDVVTGIPLELTGPDLDDKTHGFALSDGSYMFPGLRAGDYSVRVVLDFEVDADGTTVGDVLTGFGYRYSGENANPVTVTAAEESADNNLPFRITMQTIHVGAVMGTSKMATETMVGGVELTLYPTIEDADAGTNALGTMTTGAMGSDDMPNPYHGVATFHFPRAMDLGPGGQGMDHLVFAQVNPDKTGNAALKVADNSHIEIEYNATDRVSSARAKARLLNTAVNFEWQVMSNAEARDGNQFLSGWKTLLDGNLVGAGEGDDFEPDTTTEEGMASYSGSVKIADLDDDATKEFKVALDMNRKATDDDRAYDAMQPDGGENWKQSAALTHTHNALELPADNMAEDNDLGAIYVTWTTQTLVVGVHREMDDVYGYAKYESVVNGDHRPSAMAGGDMKVMVMWEAGRNNRLEVYDQWDEDCDEDPDDEPSEANKSVGSTGVVKFPCLPANQEWTVRFEEGANRDLVTDLQDIETFGGDLMEGMTIGSFGGAFGAMPEVRICSASIAVVPGYESGTDDEYCSTFGYQWATGSISGAVGAVSGLGVALEAVTTEHGQQDDDETTGTGGRYSFSGLQDGTYTVTASGNDEYSIVGAATHTKNVYHDEECWGNPDPNNSACSARELDGPDADGDYTYINVDPQSWRVSRLGLEVRGYVANVSHEHNNVVRGDETAEGLMLEIKAYSGSNSLTTGQPIPTGGVLGTAAVQSDGSYKFENLPAGRYVITAKNVAGSYEALQSGPTDNIGGAATAQEYAEITDEQMLTGKLPAWDYENSTGLRVGPQTVVVGTGASAVSNVFHNFALLHADGTFSGRVREASGDASGIAVELERCETYVAATDDGQGTTTPEECRGEDWGPQRDDASRAGNWDFPSLREGYYVVNVAAVNHRRAKWDADGINDDAADCGPGSDMPEGSSAANCDQYRTVRAISDLRGKRGFNPGGQSFYVYNSSLRDADEMTTLSVKGVTTPKKNPVAADHVELATYTAAAQDASGMNETDVTITGTVTWRAASVAVRATVSPGASYVVRAPGVTTSGAAGAATTYTPSRTGARVPLPYDGTTRGTPGEAVETTITVAVTGENGYNDHEYTFAVSRAAPQDNELATADFTPNPTGGDGLSGTPFLFATVGPTDNSMRITINREHLGDDLDWYCAQTVEVVGQTGFDTESDACADETYTLTAGPNGTTYEVKMTSEDTVTTSYWINVRRGT